MSTRHVGRIAFATATLAALLVSTACGGSSTSTPGANTPSSSGSVAAAAPGSPSATAAGGSSTAGSAMVGSSGAGPASSGASSSQRRRVQQCGPCSAGSKTDPAVSDRRGTRKPTPSRPPPRTGASSPVPPSPSPPRRTCHSNWRRAFRPIPRPTCSTSVQPTSARTPRRAICCPTATNCRTRPISYPALVQSFSVDNKLICAPKDVSTLALFINTTDWAKAGLTDADIPKNWDQLATVAKKLTTGGQVGLSISATPRPRRRLLSRRTAAA